MKHDSLLLLIGFIIGALLSFVWVGVWRMLEDALKRCVNPIERKARR